MYYRKNKTKNDGETFVLYLILYGIARFFIEGMRTDSLYIGVFRISQLVAIVAIVFGSAMFFYFRKKNKGLDR
jgi:prolipoprotein diacylglyceryltransferase